MDLVILAGGIGSRFGGLKQLEAFGPSGEFIIDYSIHDALKAGFNRVVFIINKGLEKDFEETIGKRLKGKVDYVYAYQEIDDLPLNLKPSPKRKKPWGTTQALLAAKNVVKSDFVMINADDFYGFDAYQDAAKFLKENKEDYVIIGYEVNNTLSDADSVKRGVLAYDGDNITRIIESKIDRSLLAKPLSGEEAFKLKENDLVSMNMMCFHPNVFAYLEKEFAKFIKDNYLEETKEYVITDPLSLGLDEGLFKIKLVPTKSVWFGVTYKEDAPVLKEAINKMVSEGKYPANLWK